MTEQSEDETNTGQIEISFREQYLPLEPLFCFDLMTQFIDRCIEDGKDPTPFRHAAIYIACGCSVDGKSNAPAATGGRSMPSLKNQDPFAL